jgi:hypothetical protein
MPARRQLGVLLGLCLIVACAAPPSAAPAKPAASAPPPAGASGAAPSAPSAPAAAKPTGFASARLPAPVTVKFGYTPLLSGGPIFVALERG